MKVATNAGSDADVTFSSGSPEKLWPQKKRSAQKPRIDLRKFPRLLLQKFLFQNFVLLRLAQVVVFVVVKSMDKCKSYISGSFS